uniref:Solute carrier family 12 member 8 n=1 Tax=Gouania willdenowi TaxID=441366 RepID=A0A8C5NG81_GOUWI
MKTDYTLHSQLFSSCAQGFHLSGQPWWKIKVFVWEPVLFGTWDGVFTTCMINIFGVVLFLRTGYLVGNTGVLLGMFLVSLVVLVALVTVMSGIGVCERCGVGSGGIYSMISMVLGGRVGGTVGLLYVFGQCVAGAMYITGFSESVAELLHFENQWAVRLMSTVILLLLLGINLAGVKWIVRLQLLLLAVLAVSTLDFVIGTFTHLDREHGFIGYSAMLLSSNTKPDYSSGENFFTVFGVFFPAATGVMAGFNMSSDLQQPEKNIPVGTLAAVFTSWFLYLVFVFLLGAICTREALRYDFLIAEKVSLVGFLFLLGLYISSLASCMGGLYGAPRILQCIAQERVIPSLSFLGKGRGPNKTPVAAIGLTTLLTMAFVFIGQVNILAPIVTINFMLTYSFIDYSYFSVVMTYQLQTKNKRSMLVWAKRNQQQSQSQSSIPLIETTLPRYGSGNGCSPGQGTLLEFSKDMDQIFQTFSETEKISSAQMLSHQFTTSPTDTKQRLMDSFGLEIDRKVVQEEKEKEEKLTPANEKIEVNDQLQAESQIKKSCSEQEMSAEPVNDNKGAGHEAEQQSIGIRPSHGSFYTAVFNHWIALFGALSSVLIMFVIQWVYAVANIAVAILLYFYIGKTSPGLPKGLAASFSFFMWLKLLFSICVFVRGRGSSCDEIVLTPSLSGIDLKTKQLTEENGDFASRHPFHQSSYIRLQRTDQFPFLVHQT